MTKECPYCEMLASIPLHKLFSPIGKIRITKCPWCKNEVSVSRIPWIIAVIGFVLFLIGVIGIVGYIEYRFGSIDLDSVVYWGGLIIFVLGLWNMKYVAVISTSKTDDET